jgi:FkbM family methyltransferase
MRSAPALKQRGEHLLGRAGVYRPARQAYQRLRNSEHYRWRQSARGFFGQFVPKGGLVFDVGANIGNYTEVYLELGARVVAIEPNPELAERVRLRCASRRLTVEEVALSAAEGTAELHLGIDHVHSSISDEWVELVEASEFPERFKGSVTVQVTTLDALIDRHGTPDFLKIDVEGAEREVLSGLTRTIPTISFEYQGLDLDSARDCVARVLELGDYECTFARGEQVALASGWSDAATLFERIEATDARREHSHGDIYLRARLG